MPAEPFYVELMRVFPDYQTPVIIAALRQDALIWNSLDDPAFFATVLDAAGDQARKWNPGTISLVALGQNSLLESLKSTPLQPLEGDLRQRAAKTYEETYLRGNPPTTLAKAGLLALALRERRRLTNTWHGLWGELNLPSPNPRYPLTTVWKTPLACLFAMAPDPLDMLTALLPASRSASDVDWTELILHPILSNPLTVDEQAELLAGLSGRLSPEDQMTWVEWLRKAGRDHLAAVFADHCASSFSQTTARAHPTSQIKGLIDPDGFSSLGNDGGLNSMHDSMEDIQASYQMASYHQAAGNPGLSITFYQRAVSVLRKLEAALNNQLADAAEMNNDPAAGIEARQVAINLVPDFHEARASLARSFLRSGQMEAAQKVLTGETTNPDMLLAKARLSHENGNRSEAQGFARQAFDRLRSARAVDGQGVYGRKTWPVEFIRTLLDVNLVQEAGDLAEEVLQHRPVDCELLESLCHTSLAKGLPTQAARIGRLATALKPRDPHFHRLLAEIYEQAKDWELAFPERKTIVELSPQPTGNDLLRLAKCALECRIPDQAIESCKAILKQTPEDGMALVYLGEAEWQKGNQKAAITHFNQATVTTPDLDEGWLSLARIQEISGDRIKSMETLRTAVQASPNSGKIYHAIAESCLASGAPSEALPALRKAVSLDPKSPEISAKLGEILLSLGHLDEAKTLLEKARQASPVHPDLAFLHGKILIACGETDKATSALSVKLASKPADIEPYLLYARLVGDACSKETAHRFLTGSDQQGSSRKALLIPDLESNLREALKIQPDHLEASILLAETLFQAGNISQAYDLYKDLAERVRETPTTFDGRIMLGYGKAAMATGEKEAALIALQDASLARPDDLSVQQALAEGYLHAGVPQEALQAGRAAIRIRPDNPANLVWFACLAHNLGISAEAIAALERTLELDPENSILRLRLAHLHSLDNNPGEAREVLYSIQIGNGQDSALIKQMADLWARLGDYEHAAACLEQAVQQSKNPSDELWYQLARLQKKNGAFHAALEAIHQALTLQPENPLYHFIQSEIFSTLDQVQPALECLDHALQLPPVVEKNLTTATIQPQLLAFPLITEPEDTSTPIEPAVIYARMAGLLRKQGNLPAAIEQAEKAINQKPGDLHYRALAADLAFTNLEYPRAITYLMAETAQSGDLEDESDETIRQPAFDPHVFTAEEIPAAVHRLCIIAEINLDGGKLEEASQVVEEATKICENSPRLTAIQARIHALRGDFPAAESCLEKAIVGLNRPDPMSEESPHIGSLAGPATSETDLAASGYPALSIAQAALDLFQWNVALPLFEQAARQAPNEPKPHLWLARALVFAKECQPIFNTLHVTSHIPHDLFGNPEKLDEMIDNAIQNASRLSESREVAYWSERAQGAHLQEVGEQDDQVARSTEFELQSYQKAIQLIEVDPAAAVEFAHGLVDRTRLNPVSLSCLACSADLANQPSIALTAIESALQIWNGEPVWHAIAARLNQIAGSPEGRISHLEQARQLDPEQVDYSLGLAKAHMDSGHQQDAYQIYEQASREDPENVEAWMGMAEASRRTDDLSKAMAYGEKAITLAPDHVEPHVLCSEIALQSGQIELAQRHAETALSLRSNDPHAVLMIVRVMAAQGQPADALEALELSIPTVSDPYALKVERAHLIRSLQGLDPALAALTNLAQEYPQDLQILKTLSETLAEAGRSEEAGRYAQQALLLDPRQVSLHFMVGRLEHKAGHLDQAIHHLSEAVRLAPDHLEAYLELGSTHTDRREYAFALKVFEEASRVAPRDPRPHHLSANVLKVIKDYTAAETELRRAAELAPEDVAMRRQLGAMIALNLVHRQQEAVQ